METLEDLITATLAQPVPREIIAMADHVRANHEGVVAVLAYGSCLRGVATSESLIDLYVLTSNLIGVSRNAVSRMACAVVPPNVHYAELGQTRAKYAVLPLALFTKWMRADNPYFWARFAQPTALVYGASPPVVAALSEAVRTMYANARGLGETADPLAAWGQGFAATYATELRAETVSRAASIVAANQDYYRKAALLLGDIAPAPANWPLRRITGKLWSIARLTKAAFTFTGGADYLVWKIERHSGQKIELTNWQRRHPIIAGLTLLPKLLRRGAIR